MLLHCTINTTANMKRDPVVWRLVSKPAAGRLAPSFKVACWQLQHWGCGSQVPPRSSLPAPPVHRHILSTECLQLTAPPAFLIGDMGVCLLPPLVTFHHKLPPPPFQLSSDPGSPWRSLFMQAVGGRQGASVSQVTLREEPHTVYKH